MASGERTKDILKALHNAVAQFDEEAADQWSKTALAEGVDPFTAVINGLAEGMIEAGEKYNNKEYFVPELLLSARAMKSAMEQ